MSPISSVISEQAGDHGLNSFIPGSLCNCLLCFPTPEVCVLMGVLWTTHLASGSETEASIDLFGRKSVLIIIVSDKV